MRLVGLFGGLGIGCAAAIAPLLQVTQDRQFFGTASWLVVVLIATPLLTRLLGGNQFLAQGLQLVAAVGFLWWLGATWSTTATGEGWLGSLTAAAIDDILTHAPPLPASSAASWLLLVLVAAVCVLTTLMVQTLEQPYWSLAPLVIPLMIVSTVDDELHWGYAVLVLGGFTAIMATEAAATAALTGSPTGDAARAEGDLTRLVLAAQLAVPTVIAATALALILPIGAPLAPSSSGGGGSPRITLSDPTIDLGQSLNNDANPVLLEYQTQRPGGVQLRLAALSVATPEGMTLAPLRLRSGAELPNPPSVPNAAAVDVAVTVKNFSSRYLPVPYFPTSLEAQGEWGFDAETMTIVARGNDSESATAAASFKASGLVPSFTRDEILAANVAASPPDDIDSTELPTGLPSIFGALAWEIAGDEPTAGAQALALERWLRDPTRFTYDTQAPEGDGFAALESFLVEERRGFCIHFATSMVMMARSLGIPARVAIGYTAGTKVGDETYQVRSKNMHAWPELHFAGLGWVSFEPTAAVGASPTQPQASNSPTPSASQGSPTPTPTRSEPTPDEPAAQDPTTGAQDLDPVIGWTLAGLLALVVAGAPAAFRVATRRRRLGASGPAEARLTAAWAELHDTAVDLGLAWPSGSPRSVASQLATTLPPGLADSLHLLAIQVERAWFAKHAPEPESLGAKVRGIAAGWRRGSPSRQRVMASLFPRSVRLRLQTRLIAMRGMRPRRQDGPI